MYDTLTDDEFRQLYNAVRAARLKGMRIVKAQAGNVSSERETINVDQEWPALVAEFRLRFPDENRRVRNTRAVARFY